MAEEKVTEEMRNQVLYFIKERGDVTRWTGWEENKGLILSEYPILMLALTQETLAEQVMRAALVLIEDDME